MSLVKLGQATLTLCAVSLTLPLASAGAAELADMVFTNGAIYTHGIKPIQGPD